MSNRPRGISELNWQHYRQGYEAREANQEIDESNVIQDRLLRAWWLTGFHDADSELTEDDAD